MPAPRLPPELSEEIIDILHDDLETLYACSLACKNWVARSRSHIFSSISLDNVREISKFLTAIPSLPGRYVHSLCLRFYLPSVPDPPVYEWAEEGLPILATNLTNLLKLELCNMLWTKLGAGRDEIISGFQTVRELTLNDSSFDTFTEIAELISSFPALESLTCTDDFRESNAEALPTHLRPPPLDKLQLEGSQTSKIMKWFMSGQYACHISNLDVIVNNDHVFVDVFEFLEALGPTLKHLHLALELSEIHGSSSAWNIDPQVGDLTRNTSLVSLRFSRVFHASRGITATYLQYLDYIPRLLSQIRSSELKSLWIDSRIKNKAFDCLAWGNIDQALSHPRFSRLENLTFYNDSAEVNVEKLKDHVSRGMSSLTARDPPILHFCEAENIYDYTGSDFMYSNA